MNLEETTEKSADETSMQHQQTPGKMLREARVQQGLSQQDVANKLFLKAHTIEHIESDEIDDSMSVTFTKGYVRNYAKFLGIDHELVIERFNQLHTATKPPAALQSFSQRVAKQAHDDRWMMVTWAILLLLVAAVVIWWYQQDDNANEQTMAVDAPTSKVTASERTEGVVPQRQPADRQQTQQQPQLKAVPRTNSEPAVDSQPENDTTSSLSTPPDADAQLAATEPSSAQTQSEELTTPSDSAPQSAKFTFNDECWVNIVDASGEVLATGIKKAGRVMEISGQPPISVTLGAPDDVAIVYAGENVDISGFQNGRTARFSLPLRG
ncbi:RodZ domain-containing protein [Alteromonas lipotrueiana]|uniref:RodZ domain-containing protein n=1 Tax=Alteromonas lipotrueiana TaxID=2803815 RepID=UPI001C47915A|nr:RodZ domain-containing protein [Alteromonas lipotrueiana]